MRIFPIFINKFNRKFDFQQLLGKVVDKNRTLESNSWLIQQFSILKGDVSTFFTSTRIWGTYGYSIHIQRTIKKLKYLYFMPHLKRPSKLSWSFFKYISSNFRLGFHNINEKILFRESISTDFPENYKKEKMYLEHFCRGNVNFRIKDFSTRKFSIDSKFSAKPQNTNFLISSRVVTNWDFNLWSCHWT